MNVYLDASAIVPLFVPEASTNAIVDAIEALTRPPVISDFGAGEISSAVSRHVRMGTFSELDAMSVLETFDQWIASAVEYRTVGSHDMRRAVAIVRRFDLKLRFPDALHVAICADAGLTLATRDRQMADAAITLGLSVMSIE